jgi:hypothetical protein
MRTLVEAPQAPGLYRVIWDGRDNDGRVLASGFYFCRLEAAGKRAQGKIVVLR